MSVEPDSEKQRASATPAMAGKTVLVVEDNEAEVFGYRRFLEGFKIRVFSCGLLSDARKQLKTNAIDTVLLDLDLPDGNGLELLSDIQKQTPSPGVIVITGSGGVPEAVSAMRRGVFSFLTKPVDLKALESTLEKCLNIQEVEAQRTFRQQSKHSSDTFFGKSEVMQQVIEMASLAAECETNVLINGETGTGKGVLAKWIHQNSSRSGAPLVSLNCANLKGELLKSELFGYAKGAFTSAVRDRMGLIEGANGGTLFLDEIGEMDLDSQVQLPKTVEEKAFRRLGENVVRQSNFRLICATNRDLLQQVQEGKFRNDLYYRVTVFPIELPPLRKRHEDLPGLVSFLMDTMGYQHGDVSEDVLNHLKQQVFPGNIRELKNILERALLFSRGAPLVLKHFAPSPVPQPKKTGPAKWNLDEIEADTIIAAYDAFKGNKTRMCAELGISPASLYRKLDKLKDRVQITP